MPAMMRNMRRMKQQMTGMKCSAEMDRLMMKVSAQKYAADDRLGINAANLNDVLRIVQQSQPFQRDIHFTASVLFSGLPKERQVSFCSHLTIPGM